MLMLWASGLFRALPLSCLGSSKWRRDGCGVDRSGHHPRRASHVTHVSKEPRDFTETSFQAWRLGGWDFSGVRSRRLGSRIVGTQQTMLEDCSFDSLTTHDLIEEPR